MAEDQSWVVENHVKPGRPWHDIKERLEEALQLEAFSTAYGWTPAMTRSLDELDLLHYETILRGRSIGEQNIKEKNNHG